MESAAVLKHRRLKITGNVIVRCCHFASLNCNKGSNMVYPRFLVSSQPFFIFSGFLMSISKPEGSLESTFSMKRVRCCTSFTNLACCSLN